MMQYARRAICRHASVCGFAWCFLILFALLARPGLALELTGFTQHAHDPATIVYDNGRYWLYSTAPNILVRSSSNLIEWRGEPGAFDYKDGVQPSMASVMDPKIDKPMPWNVWAPDLIKVDGHYFLYTSRNVLINSPDEGTVLCLATADSISSKTKWVDQGIVLHKNLMKDHYRVIDPSMIIDQQGRLWVVVGSFGAPNGDGFREGGIHLFELDRKTGKLKNPNDNGIRLSGAWIEAPYIYYHDGYYFLFENLDHCCMGLQSTYFIRVGRSKNITGPYVDRNGQPMTEAEHGELFLGRDLNANFISNQQERTPTDRLGSVGKEVGPGHVGIITLPDGSQRFSFHYYDASENGIPRLGIRTLLWGEDGWPRPGWEMRDGNYAIGSRLMSEAGAPAEGMFMEADAKGEPLINQADFRSANQMWSIRHVGLNQFTVSTSADPGTVLAVTGTAERPNDIQGDFKPVRMVKSSGALSEKWFIEQCSDKSFRFINCATSKCLEVAAGAKRIGAQFQTATVGHDLNRQKFSVTPAGIYRLRNLHSSLVAQVSDGKAGTQLGQGKANGEKNQLWRLLPTADGYTKIVNVSSRMVVDLTQKSTEDGAKICQQPDFANDAQRWSIEGLTDGNWRLVNKANGKVIDMLGQNEQGRAGQWSWLHVNDQQWALDLVAATPYSSSITGIK